MDGKSAGQFLCKVGGGQVNMTLDLLVCQEIAAINRPQDAESRKLMSNI